MIFIPNHTNPKIDIISFYPEDQFCGMDHPYSPNAPQDTAVRC